MGIGASGAMTDVSAYVDLGKGVSYTYGRTSEFDDVRPGEFSFVLENGDGRFTPENAASPLDTLVTEGMQVCWDLEGRLVAGTIIAIEPEFPDDEASWSRVVITCDDILGDLARTTLADSVADALERGRTLYMQWPLDDPPGEQSRETVRGELNLTLSTAAPSNAIVTQHAEGIAGISDEQLELGSVTTAVEYLSPIDSQVIAYESGSLGAWGVWVTPVDATAATILTLEVSIAGLGQTIGFRLESEGAGVRLVGFAGTTETTTLGLIAGPAYVSWLITHLGGTSAGDVDVGFTVSDAYGARGESIAFGGSGSVASAAQKATNFVSVNVGDGANRAAVRLSRLSHTSAELSEYYLLPGASLNERLAAVSQMAEGRFGYWFAGATYYDPDLFLPGLWDVKAGEMNKSGSVLDAVNDIARTEQGYLFVKTSGTVTSPTDFVVLRPRERPEAVTASFDIEDEGAEAPTIVRDITNLLRAIEVNGPSESVYVTDSTITNRTAGVGSGETELLLSRNLREWGEDRLIQGTNLRMRIVRAAFDAFNTPTDRSADLTGLVLGDRVELTGLPVTQLGFGTWEGWLLGASETHTLEEHTFELALAPVLGHDPVFDTDRFMSDGALTLNTNINSFGTSFVYATTGPEFVSSTLPVTIIVDDEQMSVTSVNQGTNTLTVTRGVNGTTGASHSSGAVIELTSEVVYAF